MKNQFLNKIAKCRDVEFNDIIFALERECETKLCHAVLKSDWSDVGLAEVLNSIGCTNTEIFRIGMGQSTLSCYCEVHLVEGEVEGIKVPYMQTISFDVDTEEISSIRYGKGLIGLLGEMCDIDELHYEYTIDPESFDVNLFCD